MARHKTIDDETLLEAARKVFGEKGAFGTTKQVAAEAKVSEALIFQRYPTKSALFLKSMTPAPPDVEEIMQLGDATDVRSALVQSAHRMLAYCRHAIPDVLRLASYPDIHLGDVMGQYSEPPLASLVSALARQLSALNEKGRIMATDPHGAAGLLVSAVHSLAVFEVLKLHGASPMDEHIERFVTTIWEGIRPGEKTHGR